MAKSKANCGETVCNCNGMSDMRILNKNIRELIQKMDSANSRNSEAGVVRCTKRISKLSTSKAVMITAECDLLGLDAGDVVEITIRKVNL